jgi:hypothetical protein
MLSLITHFAFAFCHFQAMRGKLRSASSRARQSFLELDASSQSMWSD